MNVDKLIGAGVSGILFSVIWTLVTKRKEKNSNKKSTNKKSTNKKSVNKKSVNKKK
ncbi:MAG: hypothetical protein WCR27_05980 [Eubacteriales bacterium]